MNDRLTIEPGSNPLLLLAPPAARSRSNAVRWRVVWLI